MMRGAAAQLQTAVTAAVLAYQQRLVALNASLRLALLDKDAIESGLLAFQKDFQQAATTLANDLSQAALSFEVDTTVPVEES